MRENRTAREPFLGPRESTAAADQQDQAYAHKEIGRGKEDIRNQEQS